MTKADTSVPPQVVLALEQLEGATSPTDIGSAYKTVLDWRSAEPRRTFGAPLYEIVGIFIFLAIVFLLARANTNEISEFWQGAVFGASLAAVLSAIRDWSSRRSHITMTFVDRVDQAIDRWRHAVPAMRDFPK